MSVKLIEHKGKKVLYADYRGLMTTEQQIQCLDELEQLQHKSAVSLPILSNFEGISIGAESIARTKEWGKRNELKIKRQALLGITGLKTILLRGYMAFTGQTNIKTFESEGEALDWLVS